MIGRDELARAFEEHVTAICQGVDTAGADNTRWAMHTDLEVDGDALSDTALAWCRIGGTPAAHMVHEATGFENGFLLACRVLRERAGQ